MNIVGLIPARGGSKGIPRKNLAPLGGRTLLAHTCLAAMRSTRLARTVISTDSDELAAEARRHGVEAPFLRSAQLAGDLVPMLAVVTDALRRLGSDIDAIALLQPTSPFRTAAHIDAAVASFLATGAEAVVSVVRVPHRFAPGSLMRLDGERLVPYGESGPPRRQDKPLLYARNGPAIVITCRATIESGSLYGRDCRPFVMDELSSIDIDGPDDLALAERLLGTGSGA